MKLNENLLRGLTAEQKKAAEAAQTPEELLALARETGHELSAKQLKAISGGAMCWNDETPCPEACIQHLCPEDL